MVGLEENKKMVKCCLCEKEIAVVNGYAEGNNAEPLASGRCCDYCNNTKVIPARIKGVKGY